MEQQDFQNRSSVPGGLSAQKLEEKVIGAFTGRIPHVRVSAVYRLAMAGVAATMVLLLLSYLAIIALAGYGLYYHAVKHGHLLSYGGWSGVMIYLAPLVVGGILILFMVKPLFASPPESVEPFKLDPEREKLLFEFVHEICRITNAPRPREIHADTQINASAGFRKGVLSMFGSDLVLTVGLPLAAGLTVRQFAGVLAHEFGHFSQGAGMRMSFLIQMISRWFARVVYERDAWDVHLRQWSSEADIRIAFVLWIARFFIWTTRKILWILMWLGMIISSFMLRQMEFDADAYETQLAGSKTFESTVHRLMALSVAHQHALEDIETAWDEGTLADDLTAMVMAAMDRISDDTHEKIAEVISESKTGFLDTHPSDHDRIERAKALDARGVFLPVTNDGGSELPSADDGGSQLPSKNEANPELLSSVLFADFGKTSQALSIDFYKLVLGERFQADRIRPAAEVLERQARVIEENRAYNRFFQAQISAVRGLRLSEHSPAPAEDPVLAHEALEKLRQEIMENVVAQRDAFETFDKTDERMLALKQAEVFLNADIGIDPISFGLSDSRPDTVELEKHQVLLTQHEVEEPLSRFETLMRDRLLAALGEAGRPELCARISKGDLLAEEIHRLWPTAVVMDRSLGRIWKLRDSVALLGTLTDQLRPEGNSEALIETLQSRMLGVREELLAVRDGLGDVRYPFHHEAGVISIGDHAIPEIPDSQDLGMLLDTGSAALRKLYILYFRIMGRLASIAESVESRLDLSPLPEPPKPSQRVDD